MTENISLQEYRRLTTRQRRGEPEHNEQVKIFNWAKGMVRFCPDLDLLHAIPNGGDRDPRVGKKLKAEGVKKGVPDICMPVPRKGFHGLYIELKAGKNQATPEQSEWIEKLCKQGFKALVCWESEEAINTIKEYLGIKHR